MFSAGSVSATLSGNFAPAGFMAFNAAMHKAGAEMESMEKKMTASGTRGGRSLALLGRAGATVAAGGILAVGLGLGKAVRQAMSFEAAMRNVNSIAKLSEGQFRSLSKGVLELAGKTAQAPETLAKGMYQLVSSGFDAKDSLKILASSSKAATAGLTDTETATTAVAGALNAYHLSAADAAHVSDLLFQTVNRGVITFPELAQTIGTVLPFAAKLGIGLNQVGASISTLTKEGIPAAEATTYLKDAMVTFLQPGDAMATAIKKTGAASGEALIKSKGFQGALEAVAGTTNGTTAAMKALFPDIRGAAAAFALTGKNAKTAEADVRGFNNAAVTGVTDKVFKEQSKSAAFQFQQLKANLGVLGVEVGTAILPTINDATRAVSKFIAEMNSGKGSGGDFVRSLKGDFDDLLGVITTAGHGVLLLAEGLNKVGLANIDTEQMKRGLENIDKYREKLRGDAPKIKIGVSADISQAQKALKTLAAGGAGIAKPTLKILADDTSVRTKIKALEALGISPKVAKVLADVAPAIKGATTVKQALANLHDHTVTVRADAGAAAAAFRKLDSTDLRTKVLTIIGRDISAAAKVKQIEALGISAKTARILGNNTAALAAIAAVRGLFIPDKTFNITGVVHVPSGVSATVNVAGGGKGGVGTKGGPKAAGRGPGGAERSLVAEGAAGEYVGNPLDGWVWLASPTVVDLRPQDAVIPRDPAMSGRALGIMAAMLGIPGYAGGKMSKKTPITQSKAKPLQIPDRVTYGAVPEDALRNDRDTARTEYTKRRDKIHTLDGQIKAQQQTVHDAKAGPAKTKARKHLTELQSERQKDRDGAKGLRSLAELRKEWQRLEAQVKVLHRYNQDIDRLNTLQETDRTKMATASRTGNVGAYNTAKTDRAGILRELQERYAKALQLAKPGSNFAATLAGQLAGIEGDIADLGAEQFAQDLTPAQQAAQDAAQRLADTGMTDAERQQLSQLEAAQSLAALTAPLDDDEAAAQQIAGFLTGILGEVQADPARGGAASVQAIADQLKQARDNVASFAGGGGATNTNQDLQAQLDQANARLDVSRRESEINARALAVFQGWDGGARGGSRTPNGPSITIQTLHPGDSRTLEAIGNAATAGQGQQASRISPRTYLGV